MKLVCSVVLSTLLANCVVAQEQPLASAKELAYFNHLFSMIANPLNSVADSQRREQVIVQRFQLRPDHAAALHAAAQVY